MNVILSIKPEFVEKIFSGEKQYEYRKIPGIICDTPANIWQQTKDHSGVSKSFFQKYYAGKDKGVALKIKECKKYIQEFMDMGLMATISIPGISSELSSLEQRYKAGRKKHLSLCQKCDWAKM